MANGRGGPRVPRNPASFSGVGARSRRTDGRIQPQRVPNIQEGTDLTIGEGQIIKQGQRIAPLGRAPSPQVSVPPRGGGGGLPSGGGGADLGALLGMPTNRPLEPETEGLPFGPGGGPEVLGLQAESESDKELILTWLSDKLGNAEAKAWLDEIRASRQPTSEPDIIGGDGQVSELRGTEPGGETDLLADELEESDGLADSAGVSSGVGDTDRGGAAGSPDVVDEGLEEQLSPEEIA